LNRFTFSYQLQWILHFHGEFFDVSEENIDVRK